MPSKGGKRVTPILENGEGNGFTLTNEAKGGNRVTLIDDEGNPIELGGGGTPDNYIKSIIESPPGTFTALDQDDNAIVWTGGTGATIGELKDFWRTPNFPPQNVSEVGFTPLNYAVGTGTTNLVDYDDTTKKFTVKSPGIYKFTTSLYLIILAAPLTLQSRVRIGTITSSNTNVREPQTFAVGRGVTNITSVVDFTSGNDTYNIEIFDAEAAGAAEYVTRTVIEKISTEQADILTTDDVILAGDTQTTTDVLNKLKSVELTKTALQNLPTGVFTPITFDIISGDYFELLPDNVTIKCLVAGDYTVNLGFIASTSVNSTVIKSGYSVNGSFFQGEEREFDMTSNAYVTYSLPILNANANDEFSFSLENEIAGTVNIISGDVIIEKNNVQY